jgi:hypothetical protein
MRNWPIKEQDKYRITSAEMKYRKRTAKYTWQDYKTNEDILSELTINPVVKIIQNCKTKWIQHVRQMDRQAATLNYEISTKPKTTPQKTSQLLRLIHTYHAAPMPFPCHAVPR